MAELSFKEQPTPLPVFNFDKMATGKKPEPKRHRDLLPNSVRAIVCGPSNCGKTNAVLALLTHPNGLRFANLYVYSKSLNQPKYTLLKRMLDNVEGVDFLPFTDYEQVISPDEARPESVILFDDVACEKQDHIRNYFCMGRHKHVDCFYLCQTYTRIPKHLVRDNANFLILFKQDEMNLKHVYDDHVNTDMPYAKFREMCLSCWPNHGFLVIVKDSELNEGRYRKGFDCFVTINSPAASS